MNLFEADERLRMWKEERRERQRLEKEEEDDRRYLEWQVERHRRAQRLRDRRQKEANDKLKANYGKIKSRREMIEEWKNEVKEHRMRLTEVEEEEVEQD